MNSRRAKPKQKYVEIIDFLNLLLVHMSENEDTQDEDTEQEETSVLLGGTESCRLPNNMEARQEHQLTKRYHFFYSISFVLGITTIILMTTWVFHYLDGVAWTSNPKLQFNWHPLLMTIGMVFLYAQSMLLYRTGRNTKKQSLKLCHAALHFFVFILSVIGLKAVFDSHNLATPPIPNLYSLHSWIGLITVILFACQLLAGFVTFLFPGLPMSFRGAYMHVHVSFGTAGFALAIISALMGIYEKTFFKLGMEYSALGPEATLINCIGLVLVFFGVLVLYLINESVYKRVPLAEDNMLLTAQTESAN